MQFDDFKKCISIIDGKKADTLRGFLIERFIDTQKDHFKKYIENLKEYSDGLCYTGYLWDCLKSSDQIEFNDIKALLNLKEVYVLWDIHTEERIFIENYWRFKKKDVLKLDFQVLIENLNYLPEDIYIFDESFKWLLVLTHEFENGKRWCLKSGNI